MTMDGRRRFFAIQAVMIAFSLFTHGWMVWRGYLEDGALWAAGYQSRPRSFGQDFHGDKWSPAG